MNKPRVPDPEVIFDNMSLSEIEYFADNSQDYLAWQTDSGITVINVWADVRVCYVIYNTSTHISPDIWCDLRSYGYKILFSQTKLSPDFQKLTQSFDSHRISLLFNTEYSYYAYP